MNLPFFNEISEKAPTELLGLAGQRAAEGECCCGDEDGRECEEHSDLGCDILERSISLQQISERVVAPSMGRHMSDRSERVREYFQWDHRAADRRHTQPKSKTDGTRLLIVAGN